MSKKIQNTKKNQDQEFGTLTAVPDGFTTRLGPNDKEFVVPQYLIPALDQAFVSFRKKVDLEVLKAKPQVSHGSIGTESFAASRHCHTYHRHRVICRITALPYLPSAPSHLPHHGIAILAIPCRVSATIFTHCFPGLSFL